MEPSAFGSCSLITGGRLCRVRLHDIDTGHPPLTELGLERLIADRDTSIGL